MPRKVRLVVAGPVYGAVYKGMGRSLHHYSLFSDDADYEHFLYLLESCLRQPDNTKRQYVLSQNILVWIAWQYQQ
jgi:hypothetical protein